MLGLAHGAPRPCRARSKRRTHESHPQVLPEPMSAGLTLTALLAAVGVRRRSSKR